MLRRCTYKDMAEWVRLNRAFMAYEYEEENAWEDPLRSGDLEADFREVMQHPDGPTLLFLIEKNGVSAGFMNVDRFYGIWAHGYVYLLDDFFLEAEHRGQGLGEQTLRELEAYALARGIRRIQLLGEKTNPGAVRFYQKNGYTEQQLHHFVKYLK